MASDPERTAAEAIGAAGEPAAVRDTLARILSSPAFRASQRRKDLLRYVVEQALAGRADRLKAFPIAVDVLGRDASFDPQTDPIVRIEMGRLRRDLAQYYLGEGRDDPLRIGIPKGHYAPAFEPRSGIGAPPEAPPSTQAPAVAPPIASRSHLRSLVPGILASGLALAVALAGVVWLHGPDKDETAGRTPQQAGPAVVVLPFDVVSGGEDGRLLASGLADELIDHLMRFDALEVYAGLRPESGQVVVPPAAADAVAYIVAGSVQREADRLRVAARLVDRASGQVLWSRTFDGTLSVAGIADVERELAAGIVTRLAQPYGIIPSAAAERLGRGKPSMLFAYDCVQRAFVYRRTFARELYAPARACLEESIRRDPGYADAWAMLAYAHLDAVRFGFVTPGAQAAEMAAALAAAQQAVALAPSRVRSVRSLAAIQAARGEHDEAERLHRIAVALNPDDPESRAQLGWRLTARGRWDEGGQLMAEAIERTARPPAWYHTNLGYALYLSGELERARDAAERGAGPCCGPGQAALAITEAALGHAERAKLALAEAVRQAPILERDPRAFWANFGVSDGVIDRLNDGLAKAGLVVAQPE